MPQDIAHTNQQNVLLWVFGSKDEERGRGGDGYVVVKGGWGTGVKEVEGGEG